MQTERTDSLAYSPFKRSGQETVGFPPTKAEHCQYCDIMRVLGCGIAVYLYNLPLPMLFKKKIIYYATW